MYFLLSTRPCLLVLGSSDTIIIVQRVQKVKIMQDKVTEWVINGETSGQRSNVSSLEIIFLKRRTGLSIARLKDFDCNCFLLQQCYYKQNRCISN